MSHSLHRQGTEESLKKDFILISITTKDPKKGWPDSAERMKKLGDICIQRKPNNYRQETYIFEGSYSNAHEIKALLEDLKQADLGLSVVLTGPREEVIAMARDVGLKLDSVHLSLGVFGNKQLLPDKKILEMTTMCGHHCISPFLVEELLKKLKLKTVTKDEAITQLSDLCTCHIFNPQRAKEILDALMA